MSQLSPHKSYAHLQLILPFATVLKVFLICDACIASGACALIFRVSLDNMRSRAHTDEMMWAGT